MTAAPPTTRTRSRVGAGLIIAIIGGALWVISEIVEVIGGGISDPSMALLIAGCIALTVGVPFLSVAFEGRVRRLTTPALAMIALATALEAVTDTLGWGADDVREIQERTGLLIPIFGVLLVLGTVALGIAVLFSRQLPVWIGLVLIVAPPFLPLVGALGLPDPVTSVSKSLIAIAIIGAAVVTRRNLASRAAVA